jgi:hypothetical protein
MKDRICLYLYGIAPYGDMVFPQEVQSFSFNGAPNPRRPGSGRRLPYCRAGWLFGARLLP